VQDKNDKKYLTVGQLRDILNELVDDKNKDYIFVIDSKPLSGRTFVGADPCTTCRPFAGFGFDWNEGKFFIFPSEDLFFNDVDKKF